MPSGLRLDIDPWLQDFQDAKQLADEIISSIQERNTKHRDGSSEASRMTAAARRKLGILGTKIDALQQSLNSSGNSNITENERNRRQDLTTVLQARKDQMYSMLSRNQANRDSLLSGASSQQGAQETDATAELDNHGLLQLQQEVMDDQDQHLEQLSQSVQRTRHVAVAINEELDLQVALLDELDEDVDVTQSRLRAAKRRIADVLKRSSNCKIFCYVVLLFTAILLCLLVYFKLF